METLVSAEKKRMQREKVRNASIKARVHASLRGLIYLIHHSKLKM